MNKIKRTNRKIPQSVKVKRRIAAAVAVQIANQELKHLKELQLRDGELSGLTIQVEALNEDLTEAQKQNADFRAELKKAHDIQDQIEGQLKTKDLDITEAERRLAQKDAHYKSRIEKLNKEVAFYSEVLRKQNELPLPFVNNSAFVHNWRDGWKWLSNQAFVLICFLAVTPIPEPVLALLPDHIRSYVIAFTALCGIYGRMKNQSHGVEQWRSNS